MPLTLNQERYRNQDDYNDGLININVLYMSKFHTYQTVTEETWTRALLFANDPAAGHAVVDEFVLLSQTIAGMASRQQDSKPILALFSIQTYKLVLFLGGGGGAALLGLNKVSTGD